MNEMLGLEGRFGVDFGGFVLRGISWSSIVGSVESCVEFLGSGGSEFSGKGEDEVSLALVCPCGVESSFQLAIEKG